MLSKHNVEVRRGRVDIHRDQAIVERFNRTLAERLFGHQYGVEMRLPEGQRSTAWVTRLPAVISALNKEVTRLIGQKPVDAIQTLNTLFETRWCERKEAPLRFECSLSLSTR